MRVADDAELLFLLLQKRRLTEGPVVTLGPHLIFSFARVLIHYVRLIFYLVLTRQCCCHSLWVKGALIFMTSIDSVFFLLLLLSSFGLLLFFHPPPLRWPYLFIDISPCMFHFTGTDKETGNITEDEAPMGALYFFGLTKSSCFVRIREKEKEKRERERALLLLQLPVLALFRTLQHPVSDWPVFPV